MGPAKGVEAVKGTEGERREAALLFQPLARLGRRRKRPFELKLALGAL